LSCSRLTASARRLAHLIRPPAFEELALIHRVLSDGVLVDVGAHQGGSLERFAQDGWRVIAVEPDPDNRAILTQRHGHRANVRIDPRAVAEQDGQRLTLYTSDVSTGISTLAPFHPSHRPSIEVETVRLDTLLAHEPAVTVLKTDLEGWDLIALRTFPWDRLHPRAVVCEFEDRKTVPLGYTFHDEARFLVEQGYVVLVSEWYPVVEYGRRHRWRSLRRYPLELADATGWGNLIAVDPDLDDLEGDVDPATREIDGRVRALEGDVHQG
jgi:FkbM family methyltransferase